MLFDKEKFGKSRERIVALLAEKDIIARKYFYPLVSSNKEFGQDLSGLTPVAKEFSENVLCLPLYAHLNATDILDICDVILK